MPIQHFFEPCRSAPLLGHRDVGRRWYRTVTVPVADVRFESRPFGGDEIRDLFDVPRRVVIDHSKSTDIVAVRSGGTLRSYCRPALHETMGLEDIH